eukprot:TRINITY_DN8833_c0_g3_i1.p1 TRINITY_DN8833_c0_g3~~TRINITY_DN8833_c0_g3_i1.p1  ORF type:complete len:528 (-),score=108.89 TRINITY_DN8833_c0_g3_i1:840-2357(-)
MLEESSVVEVVYRDSATVKDKALTTWRRELQELRDVALPACLANICEYLPVVFMVSFAGRLGDTPNAPSLSLTLDAVALGRSYFNFTALSVAYGALSATRTLYPQAVGSGNGKLCAVYSQRAIVAITVMFIPCSLLQFFAKQILIGLGQPRDIVLLAQDFVVYSLPTYFGWTLFAIYQRLLQAHSIAYYSFIATMVMVALSPLLLYLFVVVGKYGYLGTAYASIIYSFIPFFMMIPYIYFIKMGYVFKIQPLKEIFAWRGVVQYLRLAIPGLLQICLEWWILEAVSLLCGVLPNPTLSIGASYIITTLESIAVMGWLAVLVFNSVRVGFFIGADNVPSAKRAATLGIMTSLCFSLFLSSLVLALRKQIPYIYTTDPGIVELTSQLLYVLAGLLPFDALNNCMGGIMGGLGLQRKAAVCQLIGYYFIGMPLAVILVFWVKVPGNGVFWLWGGAALSMFSSSVMQATILWRYNWNQAVTEALARIGEEKRKEEDSVSEEQKALLSDS